MNTYLNDLSCGDPDISLVDKIDSIKQFQDLLDALGRYGFKQVIVDAQPARIRLCDIHIGEVNRDKRYFDERNIILSLINRFIFRDDLDSSKEFLYKDSSSVLLAHARDEGRCTVSFTFTPEFEVDEIIETRDKNQGKVINFHKAGQKTLVPSGVVPATECRNYNPVENPLWNSEASRAYHASVESQLDRISAEPGLKIAILERISGDIAELNGWIKDDCLSRINSNSGMVRCVYRSTDKFRKVAYLSVDFEKRDVYFELFDKRGRHKGEYKWDGVKSEEASPKDHQLKLKK